MTLFYLGVILLAGLLMGKLTKLVKLPNVTAYLVAGLLIGPSVANIIPGDVLDNLSILSEIALGFIAFTIGTQFQFSYFKKVGSRPIVIAIFESLFAVIFVFAGLLVYGLIKGDPEAVPFALVLSAIAAATAPAATIMVIKQYKAKGEVTKTLMSVVALDDAVALIIFGVNVAIANSIENNDSNMFLTILKPFGEVFISLGIGFVFGIVLTLLLKWYTGRGNRLSVILAIILITCSLSYIVTDIIHLNLSISTLLACMMIGAVFTNTTPNDTTNKILELVDRFTPPILIMFFVISGANLKLNVLITVGVIGVLYVVLRVVGKITGAWFGATITKSPKEVKKYLGPTLIPQAGVAIGLTIVAGNVVPQYSQVITAVVLCGTLIYELIGPVITKISLIKAGEITEENKRSKKEKVKEAK